MFKAYFTPWGTCVHWTGMKENEMSSIFGTIPQATVPIKIRSVVPELEQPYRQKISPCYAFYVNT
jgi:hypothetical protein